MRFDTPFFKSLPISPSVPATLFVAGFSILSLEILGIRILGPHTGTTIGVWGALIGVTLAAGACGYFLGGLIADRTAGAYYLPIIAGSGISIAAIPLLTDLLPLIAHHLSYASAAALGSMVLFFLPILFLSILTTYIIRIELTSMEVVGQVHGDLYAIATLGSIAGVFSVSHFLVPFFTLSQIVYGMSVSVILCGIFAYYDRRSK